MGLVPNLELNFENKHKATRVFLIFTLSYIDSGVGLLKSNSRPCPTRMGEPSQAKPCIVNMWFMTMGAMHIPYFGFLKFSQILRGGKRRSHKFSPTLKIGSNVQQGNEVLTDSFFFHKRIISNLQLCPSFKDFMDNLV